MIVEKINKYLSESGKVLDEALRYEVEKMAGWVFKRQFMTEEEAVTKGSIRLSSAGRCPRQTAYAYHGIEKNGKETDARSKIVFWTGDLVELTVIGLAKLAGANITATGFNQLQIKLAVNDSMITGHPDGILFEDKQQFLVEVKSMSSYGFERFLKGDIDSSYLAQVNAYMEALGLNKCVFLGLNKDSGVLHEIVLEKDSEIVDKVRKNILAVLHSEPEKLPEPPKEYGPDEKSYYAWQCRYCNWFKTCRPNAELVVVKNSYKLKEKSNGSGIHGQTEGSGEQDNEMGVGILEVQAPRRKPGRPKKDDSIVRDAEVSGRSAMESGSESKNV